MNITHKLFVLACLFAGLPLIGAAQAVDTAPALVRTPAPPSSTADVGKPKPPQPIASAPVLRILRFDAADRPVLSGEAKSSDRSPHTLHGSGDILVWLDQESSYKEREYSLGKPGVVRLFLNGVNLGDSARRIAQKSAGAAADEVVYQFNLKPGESSQALWAMLYRANGLTKEVPMHVALGWDAVGAISVGPSPSDDVKIAVSSPAARNGGLAVVLVILGLSWLMLRHTDALRDAAAPAWANQASAWLRAAKRQRLSVTPANIKAAFPAYDSKDSPAYRSAALRAITGVPLQTAQEEQQAFFGLLEQGRFKMIRGTYSLARTQMGMWFVFAMCSGVFFWIAYGNLLKIDDSILMLLGVSITTAGVSLAMDRTPDGTAKAFVPSRGLLTDLVMGGAELKEQLHRYQAVAVNLLLLIVGVRHVMQHLAYPVFDPTWLAFLGISGLAFTAGKQIIEKK